MNKLVLISPAFADGGWIPNEYSGFGEDISPELHIANIDERAVSLAVTLDDLSHPIWPGYNHWIVWNLPVINVIPAHLPPGGCIDVPLHAEQGLAYGKHCYRGPKPPFNRNHKYQFTVYVLDIQLTLNPDCRKNALINAMEGHLLQTAELCGRYQRKHK